MDHTHIFLIDCEKSLNYNYFCEDKHGEQTDKKICIFMNCCAAVTLGVIISWQIGKTGVFDYSQTGSA